MGIESAVFNADFLERNSLRILKGKVRHCLTQIETVFDSPKPSLVKVQKARFWIGTGDSGGFDKDAQTLRDGRNTISKR